MIATEYNSPQIIIDNLHTAIIVIGDKLQIVCMNPAAEMLFHISNKRATGKNISKLILNAHEFFDRLERSLVTTHPYTVHDDQLQIHTRQTIDIDYSVSPVQLAERGKYLLLEFTRLKPQHKLSHEESILSQYEASKSLLRGLAHEIKNPLGGIRGAAQLLERELHDEGNKQFTQIIINETDRLKNLLDRMVGPKDLPTKKEINVHKVLEHVRQLVAAENDQITITADYDPSVPDIYADESMLIQIILNITRNAVTAISATARENGKIVFKTRSQRNCTIASNNYPLVARIDIEDNGGGISEDLQERIFMPMITGHAEGTGLGLSIAQSLAQQHNGIIEFKSGTEKTVFTLLLPIMTQNDEKNQH